MSAAAAAAQAYSVDVVLVTDVIADLKDTPAMQERNLVYSSAGVSFAQILLEGNRHATWKCTSFAPGIQGDTAIPVAIVYSNRAYVSRVKADDGSTAFVMLKNSLGATVVASRRHVAVAERLVPITNNLNCTHGYISIVTSAQYAKHTLEDESWQIAAYLACLGCETTFATGMIPDKSMGTWKINNIKRKAELATANSYNLLCLQQQLPDNVYPATYVDSLGRREQNPPDGSIAGVATAKDITGLIYFQILQGAGHRQILGIYGKAKTQEMKDTVMSYDSDPAQANAAILARIKAEKASWNKSGASGPKLVALQTAVAWAKSLQWKRWVDAPVPPKSASDDPKKAAALANYLATVNAMETTWSNGDSFQSNLNRMIGAINSYASFFNNEATAAAPGHKSKAIPIGIGLALPSKALASFTRRGATPSATPVPVTQDVGAAAAASSGPAVSEKKKKAVTRDREDDDQD
jgi:hypothetical protein